MAETNPEDVPKVEETAAEEAPSTEKPITEEPATEVPEQQAESELQFIREPILDEEEMKKIFVGGIPLDTKDEEFKEFFETFSGAEVSDFVIIRKDKDIKSHFGFVTLASSEIVDNVLLKREELKFKDRVLDINRAVPKSHTSEGAHDKTKKLFIANLPKTCKVEELQTYFECRHPKTFGVIENIQLVHEKDETGAKKETNKGYGFITVSTEDLADKMAIQHSNFEFEGRKIELKKSARTGGSGGKGPRGRGRGARGGPPRGGGPPMYGYDWGGYGEYPGQWYGQGYGYNYYGSPYDGGYQQGGRGRGGGRYRPY